MRVSFRLLGLLAILTVSAATALTFVKASDAYLVDHAAIVVRAVVRTAEVPPLGERLSSGHNYSLPMTHYSLEVTAGLRGAAAGGRLELEVPGGVDATGRGAFVIGAPRLAPGEEALFFLEKAPSGRWRILHLQQGLFRLGELGPGLAAWRPFEDATEIVPEGAPAAEERPRDLAAFERWIADRIAGNNREPDYELAPASGSLQPRFTISSWNGLPIRWPKASAPLDVTYYAHRVPQPGLASGGYPEVQTALDAWTHLDGGYLRLRYGGLTDAATGLQHPDGTNAIVFDNYAGSVAGATTPFDCAAGRGALALGTVWVDGTHFFGGREHHTVFEGDAVTNENYDCWSLFTSLNFEHTVAHEFGHTLALGHSCGDADSGPCDTPEKFDAVMRSYNGGLNRGARLGEDDRKAIEFLYGRPVPPRDLEAEPDGDRIELSWRDAETETGYRIYRQGQQVAELGAGATSFADDGVAPFTTYRYEVRGFNEAGLGDAAEVEVTSADTNVPNQLAASAGPDFVTLTWADRSSQEHGYEVWGRLFGSDELLATLGANATTATVSGLIADSTYTFKVRATGLPYGNTAFTPPLAASTLPAAIVPCAEGAEATCLAAERFKVEVRWKDFAGQRGTGRLAPAGSADSGIFYFFSANNWEMLVKVLDGCAINQRQWVFAASTTTVETTLIVTDSQTGKTAVYYSPLGATAPAVTDIEAFAGCPESGGAATAGVAPAAPAAPLHVKSAQGEPGSCADGESRLCLLGERFEVKATWTDFAGQTGSARVVPAGSADSGIFYFFSPDNWEMLVKVLDGCALNQRVWVFAAATTNVAYTLEVKDTLTGQTRTYENPLGHPSVTTADIDAFASCPP